MLGGSALASPPVQVRQRRQNTDGVGVDLGGLGAELVPLQQKSVAVAVADRPRVPVVARRQEVGGEPL